MRSLFVSSFGAMCTLTLALTPVCSADAGDDRYDACLMMAERAPDRGINEALVWQGEGGDLRARHCEAVGLFYLGEYGEAAARLLRIAEDMEAGKDLPIRGGKRAVPDGRLVADMYAQAAAAWLLAGELVRAETAIEAALSFVQDTTPQALDLRFERARIVAASGDYAFALQDLEFIQKHDLGRKDILLFLASAARGAGQYEKAQQALSNYLAVYPKDPSAHLEQGNLFDVVGEAALARRSWITVLGLTEEGPDADAARANLERVDYKPGAGTADTPPAPD